MEQLQAQQCSQVRYGLERDMDDLIHSQKERWYMKFG